MFKTADEIDVEVEMEKGAKRRKRALGEAVHQVISHTIAHVKILGRTPDFHCITDILQKQLTRWVLIGKKVLRL